MHSIPSKTQILVVGGGPAGSYSAAALAREGFQVTLFEAVKFPRYHIGESLLPSMRSFLKFVDVEHKVEAHGFCPKPGAAFKFTQHKREGYTDFVALDPNGGSWNVVRSEFDEILLRHASASGAAVFEEVKVTSILFEGGDPSRRPIGAQYVQKNSSATNTDTPGTIHFDYLVDASGRAGIMSQRYLKNRKFNKSLDNVAFWGYWTGCQRYSPGTTRENAVFIEGLQDETGWAWFIPLHDGTVSIGVVRDQTTAAAEKRALRERQMDNSLEAYYRGQLNNSPGVMGYIGEGKLLAVGKDGGSGVKQAADFSYSADAYAGPGYRLVGDASAFIDPFFSSGVHLGLSGALSAAATISSSIRGDASEEECAKWHDVKVSTAYTRFLLVVLGAYKQMRAQKADVLSDVNEDNFDRAFDLIRPVIQGTADIGKKVTEDEVQKTMDFVNQVFVPTNPELHAAVHSGVTVTEEEARHVMAKEKTEQAISVMYDSEKDLTSRPINGRTMRMERGRLGISAPMA